MAHNDIFAGAWRGHKFPDSVYNSGPIPPKDTSGYPNGLGGQADARINYNSTLLGDLQPYAYGKPGRLSSQTAYLPVPHMVQKVVPPFRIPSAQPHQGDGTTMLYHAVDDGDLAFTIVLDRMQNKDTRWDAVDMHTFDVHRSGMTRANMDILCNLCTVNYLLAGCQLFSGKNIGLYPEWRKFMRNIGILEDGKDKEEIELDDVLDMMANVFIPFGIPRGSDQQGGQSQGGASMTNRPDQYPVDYVTSLLLDGKCQNMINIWKKADVHAGDSMILVLRRSKPKQYVLSRHVQAYNLQDFTTGEAAIQGKIEAGVWQVFPHILNMADSAFVEGTYDYRYMGYWHICTALQMARADPSHRDDVFNDATRYRKTGELLEVSFEPVPIIRTGFTASSSTPAGSSPSDPGSTSLTTLIVDPKAAEIAEIEEKLLVLESELEINNYMLKDSKAKENEAIRKEAEALSALRADEDSEDKKTVYTIAQVTTRTFQEKVEKYQSLVNVHEVSITRLKEKLSELKGLSSTAVAGGDSRVHLVDKTLNYSAAPTVFDDKAKHSLVENPGKQKRTSTRPDSQGKKAKRTLATVLNTPLQEGVAGVMTNIRATLLKENMDEH